MEWGISFFSILFNIYVFVFEKKNLKILAFFFIPLYNLFIHSVPCYNCVAGFCELCFWRLWR